MVLGGWSHQHQHLYAKYYIFPPQTCSWSNVHVQEDRHGTAPSSSHPRMEMCECSADEHQYDNMSSDGAITWS